MDQKFYVFIKFLFISRKQINNKEYKFLVDVDVLSDLGVDNNIQLKYKEFLSNKQIDYLKDIKIKEYASLKQELVKYCKLRDCKFNDSNWKKLIYMLKSIEYFKLKDIKNIGENLLINLKNDYKTFGTVNQILGVSKTEVNEVSVMDKKKDWKRKGWNKKTYQKTFDLYLKNVIYLINERLISWISDRNKILFSDVSNWKIVFDEIILNLNKYLGLLLFNKASNKLILSSNPKIISYINKINKINISAFYAGNKKCREFIRIIIKDGNNECFRK